MRGVTKTAAALLAAVLLPVAAYAQAAIAGTVKDASGGVLPGVTVEASSPVLIEKTRSVVSDGSGNYRIENLRPGTYAVTFTLTGFNTVKRDNVDVVGSGTATVDADLKVGAIEETITVTGETPIVDISTTTKQAVLDHDSVQSLPTSRNYVTLARLVPGTTGGTSDVGGSTTAGVGGSVQIHGSRSVDQRILLNGLSIMTLQAGGNIGGQQPDVGSAAELTIDTSSLSAEMSTGGVRINFIPKDGGNTFSDSTFFTFANESMQGNNFTTALQQAGLATPNKLKKAEDLNESVGGPIVKDQVWFYFSTRYNRANSYAGVLANLNAGNPNAWSYQPDPNSPAANQAWVQQNNLRVTWQATPKVKVAGEQKVDHWCQCPNQLSATRAPETGVEFRFPRLRQEHAEFTAPVTNKFLLEAVGMHLFERWGNMDMHVSHGSFDGQGSFDNPQIEQTFPQMISVVEQAALNGGAAGLRYRVNNSYNNTVVPNYTYRVAASYVTGSHAFKTGWNDTWGYQTTTTYNFQPIEYRFLNGSPNQLTQWATPFTATNNENHDFGMFAQDVYKVNHFTVNGAIRYDWFKTGFPAQTLEPAILYPSRNIQFPAQDNMDLKDITYRTGFAWDIRGDGKTAVKFAANKYLLGQTLNGLGSSPNPVNALVTSANRSWNDANHDFIPECDLTNNAANGECGATSGPIGSTIPLAKFTPDLLTGFGHRQANWEFTAGVQQEILPRISVDVTYFRRIWQHFQVTDQVLTSDLTTRPTYVPYTVTVPLDARLPGGGGYQMTYFDIDPTQVGKTTNINTLSDDVGNMSQHWNGVDVLFNGRLQQGFQFQAGISTGHDTLDFCGIANAAPEYLTLSSGAGNGQIALQNCRINEPWLTSFKAYGAYTLPKVDVQIAVTYRDIPGMASTDNPSGLHANFVATNAFLATNSNLGRNLAGTSTATQNTTLQIIDPDTVYLPRDRQLDLRFGKVVRWMRTRSTINVDLYNALNRSTILSENASFSSWQAPTSIVNPRLLKVSFTVDLR